MTKTLYQKYMRVLTHTDFWSHDPKMALNNAWCYKFTNPLLPKNLKEFNEKYAVDLNRSELRLLCTLIEKSRDCNLKPVFILKQFKKLFL